MSKIINNYINGDYIVTEYESGTVVKQLIPQCNQEQIEPTVYQPTSIEIAQQIEDLRADLIIAGVI